MLFVIGSVGSVGHCTTCYLLFVVHNSLLHQKDPTPATLGFACTTMINIPKLVDKHYRKMLDEEKVPTVYLADKVQVPNKILHSMQHTTYNIQHTTYNIQHTTYNIQHTTFPPPPVLSQSNIPTHNC
jgi:hypothetical protein